MWSTRTEDAATLLILSEAQIGPVSMLPPCSALRRTHFPPPLFPQYILMSLVANSLP